MDAYTVQRAIDSGILDATTIHEQLKAMEDKIYLGEHKFKVWQDPKGRWTTYLPQDKGRKLIKKSTLKDLNRAIIDFYKDKDPQNHFETLLDEWIERKLTRCEIQRQSADRYRATFKTYISKSVLNKMEFDQITHDILDTYVIDVIKTNELTAKGWADIRLVLRGVFKYAYKIGRTKLRIEDFFDELDLSPKIFKRRAIFSENQVFTDDEIDKIEKYIYSQDELKVVDLGILLSFNTGLRCGELITLRFSDYDKKTGVLKVMRTEVQCKNNDGTVNYSIRDCTKGKIGYREVILLDDAIDILDKMSHLTNSDEIFVGRHKGVFTNRLYRICDAIGIEHKSLHKCRKTYATRLLDGNVPESLILSQMGHTDITTTKNHYYYNRKKVSEMREKLISCVGQN